MSGACSEVLAFDTLKLLDHVWPGEAVHVMGASMGGFVAQVYVFQKSFDVFNSLRSAQRTDKSDILCSNWLCCCCL